MKTIIAGPRGVDRIPIVTEAIHRCPWKITEVVSGGCRGVDRTAESVARRLELPVKVFEADWDRHGKAAGPIRNREMAEYADGLIALWNGISRGTKNMIETAERMGLRVFKYYLQ